MLAPQHPARLRLSAKVRRLYRQGKISEALDTHYEDMVRDKTAGQSGDVQGREIDVLLDDAFIQVKRSYAAIERPRNFLNSHIRRQIKITVRLAQDSGRRAEFWFKYGVHPMVKTYIGDRGGTVIIGLGE
jgi:hypothetical protein